MKDKAEIIAELKGLGNLFEEKFKNNDESHKAILEQVTKTNGRVTSLETLKNRIIGGIIIGNAIIIPLTIWLFTNKILK